MAKAVLTAAYLAINAVDRSSWLSKAELTIDVEEKDATVFTSGGAKEVLGGLKSGKLAVGLKNDVAVSQLDETMFALLGTVVTFELRPSNAAVGTSNPKYTGSILINSWTPVSAAPGDVNEASYTFTTSGAIARATS